ncbi:hypothetical protein [Murine herpesvirus strain 4556]|uniref:Uncharacterized protein n=2 Tax=Orthoherpesviridae TaxID=3044472 RepID=O41960_MHV68|nr:unknown [Murid gammaherpesvirus 4]AXP99137.1 unknown protein [synthetic construct]QPD95862.1 hypothetical protein [Murine herpesvirus]UNZ86685.1 hypothetical protein [Murine herpesvirus strain 72]UNZ86762.1 hypothetical protein [Murine herpesvirus strain 4556]AAB66414.1 unknown [Murid gammaherpesvirus 4]
MKKVSSQILHQLRSQRGQSGMWCTNLTHSSTTHHQHPRQTSSHLLQRLESAPCLLKLSTTLLCLEIQQSMSLHPKEAILTTPDAVHREKMLTRSRKGDQTHEDQTDGTRKARNNIGPPNLFWITAKFQEQSTKMPNCWCLQLVNCAQSSILIGLWML